MVKREMVEAHVEKLLGEITGSTTLTRDSQGDWPFVLQRSVMYVRITRGDQVAVKVWGVAAHSVPEGPELFGLLNDINNGIQFCRALWSGGAVLIATELVGESLDLEDLSTALSRVGGAADHYGPKVVEACGGETPRPVAPPDPPIAKPDDSGSGLYL